MVILLVRVGMDDASELCYCKGRILATFSVARLHPWNVIRDNNIAVTCDYYAISIPYAPGITRCRLRKSDPFRIAFFLLF